jgi:ribosomal protein S18 acetylase RimI-like enzyme
MDSGKFISRDRRHRLYLIMPHGAWSIRPASIHDAPAITEVHVENYRSAYRGIFPEAHLNGVSVEKREPIWRDLLAAHDPSAITMVGCDAGGSVVGFASGGKERTGKLGCDGELYSIYLLQEAQRRGLGALLVRQFAHELVTREFSSMAVWVLALNPARKFYECLGGKVIGEKQIERGGQTFIEVAYGWQSLNVFR